MITGIEQWTNAVIVNKELAPKLSRGETPLSKEERENERKELIEEMQETELKTLKKQANTRKNTKQQTEGPE